MRITQKALTFDDVLLLPAHSNVLPRDVSLRTRLTRNITPEHSAGVRRDGHRDRGAPGHRPGAGGRHRHHPQEHDRQGAGGPSCQGQALRERACCAIPITIPPNMTVRDVLELTRQHKISGLPVVEGKHSRRHRHQPRPALRDAIWTSRCSNIMTPRERLVTVKEGASREEAQGADAQASPRARAGGQRRIRAARPDHGQGHPQVHRASRWPQGRAGQAARRRRGRRRRRHAKSASSCWSRPAST